MTKQSPPELFAQRPVRSDFTRRRPVVVAGKGATGAIPRRVLLAGSLLLLALGGGVAWSLFGSGDSANGAKGDVPDIQAEMPIKKRPDDPGGIDIPHQDVTVFQQLDQKAGTPPSGGPEQLLPPPETPVLGQEEAQTPPSPNEEAQGQGQGHAPAPADAGSPATAQPAPDGPLPPALVEAPPETPAPPPPVPAAQKQSSPPAQEKKAEAPPKPQPKATPTKTATTKPEKTTQKDASVTPSRLPKEFFITGEIPKAQEPSAQIAAEPSPSVAPETSAPPSSGKVLSVQLASLPDRGEAEKTLSSYRAKYADALGGASLRVVQADLGPKGTYYRVMSEGLPEAKAKALCAALKARKAACILAKGP